MILASDLDNTLIFSRRKIAEIPSRVIEWKQGVPITYMAEETYEKWKALPKSICLIPVTTRSFAEYRRTIFYEESRYAVISNGGILLKDGEPDEQWFRETKQMIKESDEQLLEAERLLKNREEIYKLRMVDELFLFAKSSQPELTKRELEQRLDREKAVIRLNGQKVYVLPVRLSKGRAMKRLRERFPKEVFFAAGDSEFDWPMLVRADRGVFPEHGQESFAQYQSRRKEAVLPEAVMFSGEQAFFSSFVLEEAVRFSLAAANEEGQR